MRGKSIDRELNFLSNVFMFGAVVSAFCSGLLLGYVLWGFG